MFILKPTQLVFLPLESLFGDFMSSFLRILNMHDSIYLQLLIPPQSLPQLLQLLLLQLFQLIYFVFIVLLAAIDLRIIFLLVGLHGGFQLSNCISKFSYFFGILTAHAGSQVIDLFADLGFPL